MVTYITQDAGVSSYSKRRRLSTSPLRGMPVGAMEALPAQPSIHDALCYYRSCGESDRHCTAPHRERKARACASTTSCSTTTINAVPATPRYPSSLQKHQQPELVPREDCFFYRASLPCAAHCSEPSPDEAVVWAISAPASSAPEPGFAWQYAPEPSPAWAPTTPPLASSLHEVPITIGLPWGVAYPSHPTVPTATSSVNTRCAVVTTGPLKVTSSAACTASAVPAGHAVHSNWAPPTPPGEATPSTLVPRMVEVQLAPVPRYTPTVTTGDIRSTRSSKGRATTADATTTGPTASQATAAASQVTANVAAAAACGIHPRSTAISRRRPKSADPASGVDLARQVLLRLWPLVHKTVQETKLQAQPKPQALQVAAEVKFEANTGRCIVKAARDAGCGPAQQILILPSGSCGGVSISGGGSAVAQRASQSACCEPSVHQPEGLAEATRTSQAPLKETKQEVQLQTHCDVRSQFTEQAQAGQQDTSCHSSKWLPAEASSEPALASLESLLEATAAAAAAVAAFAPPSASIKLCLEGSGEAADINRVATAHDNYDAASGGGVDTAAPANPAAGQRVPQLPPVPLVEPEAFFEPDGSLVKGAVLQTACNIIRLSKQQRGALAISLPWCESDGPEISPKIKNAALSLSSSPSSSSSSAAAAVATAALLSRRGVPLYAALHMLTSYAGAARALQLAESRLVAQMAVVSATASLSVAQQQRLSAAQDSLRALWPLMHRGHKYAEVMMANVERALTGEPPIASSPSHSSPSFV